MRNFAVLITALSLTVPTGGALAAERTWTGGESGDFGNEANWDDGRSGVPGPGDTVIFDVVGIVRVTLHEDRTLDRLIARRGIVDLVDHPDAGPLHLELTSADPAAPGLVVGEQATDLVELSLDLGSVSVVDAVMGLGAGSFGTLGWWRELTVTGKLVVGRDGWGEIETGGALTTPRCVIAESVQSYGSVRAVGKAADWQIAEEVVVGAGGIGSLEMDDGAALTCDEVIVGDAGTAWLEMCGGAVLTCETLVAGDAVGASGDLTMSGSDTHLDVAGALTIGDGEGTLEVNENAEAEIGGELHLRADGPDTLIVGAGSFVRVAGDAEVTATGGEDSLVIVLRTLFSPLPQEASLSISGTAQLDALRVELDDNFFLLAPQTFALVEAASGLDTVLVELPPPPAGYIWSLVQTSSRIEVTADADLCAVVGEDCNDNGISDLCDVLFGDSRDDDCDFVPDECQRCPLDLDADGSIGFDDLTLHLGTWGECANFDSLTRLLGQWGPCPKGG